MSYFSKHATLTISAGRGTWNYKNNQLLCTSNCWSWSVREYRKRKGEGGLGVCVGYTYTGAFGKKQSVLDTIESYF